MKEKRFYYWLLLLGLLRTGCASSSLPPISPDTQIMSTIRSASLNVNSFLQWSDNLSEGVTKEIPRPESSMLVTGPLLNKLSRTNIKLYPGSSHPWGVVVNGLGQASNACIALGAQHKVFQASGAITGVCELPQKQALFLASEDGVERIELQQHALPEKLLDTPVPLMLAAGDTTFWTYQLQEGQIALRNWEGKAVARYPLPDFRRTMASQQGSLCFPSGNPISWVVMDENGNRRALKNFPYQPFEEPLYLDANCLVTAGPDRLHWSKQDGTTQQFPLLNAGVSSQGVPFTSGFIEEAILLTLGDKQLHLEIPASNGSNAGPSYVFAIDQDGIWVMNRRACHVFNEKGVHQKTMSLSNELLEQLIFPRQWIMGSILVTDANSFWVSCAGPTGIALIHSQLQ